MRFADIIGDTVVNVFVASDEETAKTFAVGIPIASDTAQIGFIFDEETGELNAKPELFNEENPAPAEETPAIEG